MNKNVVLIVLLIFVTSCKEKLAIPSFYRSGGIEVASAHTSDENEGFTVIYRQKVNGYSVKAKVRKDIDSEFGELSADITFSMKGKSFTLHTTCFGDTVYSKGRLDYDGENEKIIKEYRNKTVYNDYHRNEQNDNYMLGFTPFFFKDMDFDGKEELVIVHYSMAVRYHSGFDVYRIVEGKPVLIDYAPYKYGDEKYGMTDYPEFDVKEKTIACPYPEGPGGLPYKGRVIYGIGKTKDVVVVDGKKHYFDHMEKIREIEY